MSLISLLAPTIHSLIPVAHADGVPTAIQPVGNVNDTPLSLPALITTVFTQGLGIATLIAGVLAVFYLIYMGIMYITSAGSPDKTKVARAGIINAVIGIIIIVAAYAIITLSISLGKTAACSGLTGASYTTCINSTPSPVPTT